MKSIKLLFLFLLLGTYNTQSQVLLSLIFGDKLNSEGLEFGLEGGVNYSSISDIGGGNNIANYNLGFYFDITLNNQLHLDTGVLVKSTLGANNLTSDDLIFLGIEPEPMTGTYSQKIGYFVVPILLKYNLKNRIYFEAGPQVSLMTRSHVEFNYENETEEIKIKYDNTSAINKIDAGFTIGTGYKLQKKDGLTLGIKYYMGLTDVYKEKHGTKNNALFLKLNIPIGANAAKEKREEKNKSIKKEHT